jgi:hypothetical protein
MLASMVFLFCSRLVGALSLVLAFARTSAIALGRLWGVATLRVALVDVGLTKISGSATRGAG